MFVILNILILLEDYGVRDDLFSFVLEMGYINDGRLKYLILYYLGSWS